MHTLINSLSHTHTCMYKHLHNSELSVTLFSLCLLNNYLILILNWNAKGPASQRPYSQQHHSTALKHVIQSLPPQFSVMQSTHDVTHWIRSAVDSLLTSRFKLNIDRNFYGINRSLMITSFFTRSPWEPVCVCVFTVLIFLILAHFT